MGDSEAGATSFGSVAGSYDRVRPGPAPAAVDWLLPAGCPVAVDLAAGTASQVITADPAERAAGLARSRAALLARAFREGGTEVVRMPMRSWCWRADKVPARG